MAQAIAQGIGLGNSLTVPARFVSVITPAYNEAENLGALFERLERVFEGLQAGWEWIVVDDGSRDGTFAELQRMAGGGQHIRAVRLARNFGSHAAIMCGLERAKGDCAVIMAADQQDPPEEVPNLLRRWQRGAQLVWAVRASRHGEGAGKIGFARLYYWVMREVVRLRGMPAKGADFFLVDRRVIDAAVTFRERNVSVLALLAWLGFRQDTIYYDKQPRLHGASGWSLTKKLKLVVDSVTSFSFLPVRLMSLVGFAVALGGFVYAGHVIFNALTGSPVQGWSSLMVVVLVIGGIQMLMMGVLGEYLWRALDEARARPRYVIEAEIPPLGQGATEESGRDGDVRF